MPPHLHVVHQRAAQQNAGVSEVEGKQQLHFEKPLLSGIVAVLYAQ